MAVMAVLKHMADKSTVNFSFSPSWFSLYFE
jgi:hypothetical protein